METYVIVIFAILVILTFVVSKNNRRFIIYSITGLKKYFDKKLDYQEKNIENLYNNLYKYITKDELEEYAKSYALKDEIIIKDDLQNYALKGDLQNYALKGDLQNYALKGEIKNYALKDDLQSFVSKKDFLTYIYQQKEQINKKSNIVDVEVNSQILETEKYKILSKIVDALLKENKPKEITNKQEITKKDNIDEIMNEKLDTILPPSKLFDVYQPNWFK
jgi:hypothetical protein